MAILWSLPVLYGLLPNALYSAWSNFVEGVKILMEPFDEVLLQKGNG
jgi:hypothetical protein